MNFFSLLKKANGIDFYTSSRSFLVSFCLSYLYAVAHFSLIFTFVHRLFALNRE